MTDEHSLYSISLHLSNICSTFTKYSANMYEHETQMYRTFRSETNSCSMEKERLDLTKSL
jgi:hypothetical protein